MNAEQPGNQNTVRYKVAHIRQKGVDLILIPLDRSFGQTKVEAQSEVLASLQHYASQAGLKGKVVPVWQLPNGQTGFVAEKALHPLLRQLDYAFVATHLNRELVVKHARSPQLESSHSEGAAAETRTSGGALLVEGDLPGCEILVDGGFAGNLPAKLRLSPGTHEVQVTKPGYKVFRKQIVISEASEMTLHAAMERETIDFDLSGEAKMQVLMENRNKVTEFQQKHRIGLMTLLFTDTVDSTRLKQELGDREAVELIQRHHSLVRAVLARFSDGEEISTAGDSFFIVFCKPSEAVKFALFMQAELRKFSEEIGWPIFDRIGIHVGEVFIEENAGAAKPKDLYGIQVDTCARVMSLGLGNQILLTRFAYENAKQVLRGQEVERLGNLVWLSHGHFILKGVEEPLEICEVGEEGMAPFRPPANSDKVQRVGQSGGGEQPAAPARHVVQSTTVRSTFGR